jgi:hypothetical protein
MRESQNKNLMWLSEQFLELVSVLKEASRNKAKKKKLKTICVFNRKYWLNCIGLKRKIFICSVDTIPLIVEGERTTFFILLQRSHPTRLRYLSVATDWRDDDIGTDDNDSDNNNSGDNDSGKTDDYFGDMWQRHQCVRWRNSGKLVAIFLAELNAASKLMHTINEVNVFCFLSSLPLLPTATTAVFGSYLSSLYS